MNADVPPSCHAASSEQRAVAEAAHRPQWPVWLIVAYLCGAAGTVVAALTLSLRADWQGRPALELLNPLFTDLVCHGQTLSELDLPRSWILPTSGPLLVLYLAFSRLPWLQPRSSGGRGLWRADRRWALVEAAGLAFLTLLVVAYRFYALNRIPRDFISELVFQIVCTSDWNELFAVNGGVAPNAPWAPLGTLHYLLMAVLWRFSGATVLTMGFAAAISSVLVTLVLYWLVRHLDGAVAALIAASLYAASPVEMVWGRHSMYPFNFPATIVLLVALTTYCAVTRFGLSYWLLLVLLMGLTYHTFGSAYGGCLIPIGVVAWLLLFDRARLRRCTWKPALLVIGVALWLGGPALAASLGAGEPTWISALDPRLGSRAFRGVGWGGSLQALGANLAMIVQQVYVGLNGDTHQTPTAVFGPDPVIVVPALAAALFAVGLAWIAVNRRRPAAPVMFSLLVAAVVPGLISTADPHRQAALYPALCGLAGLTAATGLRRLRATVSHHRRCRDRDARFRRAAAPVRARRGAVLLPAGRRTPFGHDRAQHQGTGHPGTLLVLTLPFSLGVDVAYLLFDDSLVEPFGWMFIDEQEWAAEVRDFRPRFVHLFHQHTALRHRLPELENTQWRRMVFVIHDSLQPGAKVEQLKAKYGAVTVTTLRPVTWRSSEDAFTVISVIPIRRGE